MTGKLRFSAQGGTLTESVGGRVVVRDPVKMQAKAEQWSRDALDCQHHGNVPLAKFFARRALELQLALSALESWKRCAG